jgi:hypothetical protein
VSFTGTTMCAHREVRRSISGRSQSNVEPGASKLDCDGFGTSPCLDHRGIGVWYWPNADGWRVNRCDETTIAGAAAAQRILVNLSGNTLLRLTHTRPPSSTAFRQPTYGWACG